MPFDSESFKVEDADASSQDVYEVQFPDWGVRTQPAGQVSVNPNFQFPPPGQPGLPSLAAVAIGARSTVDRAWVSWDRLKLVSAIPGSGEMAPIVKESRLRPVSVQHPITYQTAGKDNAAPLPSTLPFPPPENANQNNSPVRAMHDGLLYVFPKDSLPPYVNAQEIADASAIMTVAERTTILPDSFTDQAGVVWAFVATAGGGFLITPYLELVLYLRLPLIPPPTDRAPYHLSAVGQVQTTGTFQPVGYIPIFGRRHVGVTLKNARVDATDYRLGFLRAMRENSVSGGAEVLEAPAGTVLAVPAGHTAGFTFHNPCADYLTIFANVPTSTFISVELAAYD